MLLDDLSQYLKLAEVAIKNLKEAYIERYEEEIIADNRVNLRIRVRFRNGYLLELNEAMIHEGG